MSWRSHWLTADGEKGAVYTFSSGASEEQQRASGLSVPQKRIVRLRITVAASGTDRAVIQLFKFLYPLPPFRDLETFRFYE